MIRYILPFVALLALGGCETYIARAMMDAAYLQEAASSYVREVHALRQWIREECLASLVRETESLKRAGGEVALRKMLAESYPSLVTAGVVKSARDDQAGILAQAPGCE